MTGPAVRWSVDVARATKHRAYVGYKRLRWPFYERTEPIVQAWHRLRPYRYDPADFAGTFVTESIPMDRESTEPVPRRIWCFWTGPNPLPPNRAAALAEMREVCSATEITLVTQATLADHLLPEAPLHPAYDGLSFVHRADYLRCYFLHFYGGGYADIKFLSTPWTAAFDRMDASDAWLMGYRNPLRLLTPNFTDRRMQRLMVRTSDLRLGQTAYIARPRTPVTAEWWRELNRVLYEVAPRLGTSPGAIRADSHAGEYPLTWNRILAQILDPLTVKYSDHLLYEPSLLPDLSRSYL